MPIFGKLGFKVSPFYWVGGGGEKCSISNTIHNKDFTRFKIDVLIGVGEVFVSYT